MLTDYRTQADAERDARVAIWGDATFAKREHVGFPFGAKGDPLGVTAVVGRLVVIAVAATVNGRTVVFTFDGYGRRDAKPLVLAGR